MHPETVFNVPRGCIERIPKEKFMFFLDVKSNTEALKDIRANGLTKYPYFVVDPFDRSNLPSIESDITEGSENLIKFQRRVKITCQ